MPTTKKPAPKRKAAVAKSAVKPKSPPAPQAQSLWILGFVTIGVLAAILISIIHAYNQPASAQNVADDFFKAVNNCDVAKLQKLYPTHFSDKKIQATFASQCNPGQTTAIFLKDYNTGTRKQSGNTVTKTDNFEYQLVASGQRATANVQMVWTSKTNTWLVAGVQTATTK